LKRHFSIYLVLLSNNFFTDLQQHMIYFLLLFSIVIQYFKELTLISLKRYYNVASLANNKRDYETQLHQRVTKTTNEKKEEWQAMTAPEGKWRKTGLDASQWQTARAKISLHRVFPFRVRPINVDRPLALARILHRGVRKAQLCFIRLSFFYVEGGTRKGNT